VSRSLRFAAAVVVSLAMGACAQKSPPPLAVAAWSPPPAATASAPAAPLHVAGCSTIYPAQPTEGYGCFWLSNLTWCRVDFSASVSTYAACKQADSCTAGGGRGSGGGCYMWSTCSTCAPEFGGGVDGDGGVPWRPLEATILARGDDQDRSRPPPTALVAARASGCADGSREAFRNEGRYPGIAGCAGAFSRPGIAPDAPPACSRGAGNDGAVASGKGCNASDLCEKGWQVCRGAADVHALSRDGCAGAADAGPGSFFATGQSGPGCGFCATGKDTDCGPESCRAGCAQTKATTNDIFGCGNAGAVPERGSCDPLDRFSHDLCQSIAHSWVCPAGGGGNEREIALVTKTDASGGGVLCCRN
jgi:hypothetical protein